MDQAKKNPLSDLIVIGKLDGTLAGIKAERLKLEGSLSSKQAAVKKAEQDLKARTKVHEEKRARQSKDEKLLKEESQKLVDRRKALSTLNNYKLQEKAAHEIELASKQLNTREEVLLKEMEEVERLAKDIAKAKELLDTNSEELEKLKTESHEIFVSLEERQSRHVAEREKQAVEIPEQMLKTYERIKDKFPMDAIVPVKNNSCCGCHMQTPAQIMVQIARGDEIVRCRGCGRILYIEESSS